jgi:hypothetical protein
MSAAAWFIIAKYWKWYQCPSACTGELFSIQTMRHYSAIKKKETIGSTMWIKPRNIALNERSLV